ncbi:hypothetical protein HNV28_33080 [Myxococcus xanthus]|uniref:Uncharacterized protein n=1 Tax=Myxococcus xanthus TaxID=34 RepID=A0A7Y4IPW8_MYXXA|nr:hypothetical protein [Myxococcus xanthus]
MARVPVSMAGASSAQLVAAKAGRDDSDKAPIKAETGDTPSKRASRAASPIRSA